MFEIAKAISIGVIKPVSPPVSLICNKNEGKLSFNQKTRLSDRPQTKQSILKVALFKLFN